MTQTPLTASDLHAVADVVEATETGTAAALLASPLVGRVEIYRPDSRSDEGPIGHLVQADDWYGFVPAVAR
jgi:hypothetical protein